MNRCVTVPETLPAGASILRDAAPERPRWRTGWGQASPKGPRSIPFDSPQDASVDPTEALCRTTHPNSLGGSKSIDSEKAYMPAGLGIAPGRSGVIREYEPEADATVMILTTYLIAFRHGAVDGPIVEAPAP